MSSTKDEQPNEQKLNGDAHEGEGGGDGVSTEELNALDTTDNNNDNPMPSSEQQEETIKKKYGGLLPKKPPLISKDHERAFFDSADWALGKGKPKGPVEALRPKLQPTPHQQVRRSAYAPADDGEVEGGHIDTATEDRSSLDSSSDSNSNAAT